MNSANANKYQFSKSINRNVYTTGIFLFLLLHIGKTSAHAQRVGIGTTQPKAVLHVLDSNVVFSANDNFPDYPVDPPISGGGRRLMWYSDKAAFRAGHVIGTNWDKDSIGYASVAIGFDCKAKGDASVALGFSKANAANSVAMGTAESHGFESIAIGSRSYSYGQYSVSLGQNNHSYGNSSLAGGVGSVAYGLGSSAIGLGTVSKALGSTTVGIYNDSSDVPNSYSESYTDRIFQVGSGSYNFRNNALTILRSGKTGIGTLIPEAFLHIKGNSYPTPTLLLEESENDFARLQFKNTTVGRFWEIGAKPSGTNSAASFEIWHAGGLNNIFTIRGDGNATLLGSLTQASDIRLKKEINKLSPVLEKFDHLNAYSYFWKDSSMDQQQQIGLLAQEVEKVFPTLVRVDDKGIKSVNYISLIPVLLAAIQELQAEVKSLKKQGAN